MLAQPASEQELHEKSYSCGKMENKATKLSTLARLAVGESETLQIDEFLGPLRVGLVAQAIIQAA